MVVCLVVVILLAVLVIFLLFVPLLIVLVSSFLFHMVLSGWGYFIRLVLLVTVV